MSPQFPEGFAEWLFLYDESTMEKEYAKMKNAISLISQLREIIGQLRKTLNMQKKYDPLPEKVKKNTLASYEAGSRIFEQLTKLEIGKIGEEIEKLRKFFLEDAKSFKENGNIRLLRSNV